MRKRWWAAALLVAGLGGQMAVACDRPSGADTLETGVLAWANAEREARGLAALQDDPRLKKAAIRHVCDMATRGYFAHAREGGPRLKERVKSAGYKMRKAGENIAYTQQIKVTSVAGVWRESPPHWAAIISRDFKDAAVAVAQGKDGKIYWVMDFGRK